MARGSYIAAIISWWYDRDKAATIDQ